MSCMPSGAPMAVGIPVAIAATSASYEEVRVEDAHARACARREIAAVVDSSATAVCARGERTALDCSRVSKAPGASVPAEVSVHVLVRVQINPVAARSEEIRLRLSTIHNWHIIAAQGEDEAAPERIGGEGVGVPRLQAEAVTNCNSCCHASYTGCKRRHPAACCVGSVHYVFRFDCGHQDLWLRCPDWCRNGHVWGVHRGRHSEANDRLLSQHSGRAAQQSSATPSPTMCSTAYG